MDTTILEPVTPRPRRRDDETTEETPAVRPSDEVVAQRAYEMFLMRGSQHGHDIDDWLHAERELMDPANEAERFTRALNDTSQN